MLTVLAKRGKLSQHDGIHLDNINYGLLRGSIKDNCTVTQFHTIHAYQLL